MSGPSIPPPIAQLGARSFSFYPAILNIQHNEWVYQSATWSEVLVRNTGSNETISIPRRYVGDVSRVEAPVMIVGLLAELEYREGAVCPARRRVIEMPLAVNESFAVRPAPARSEPAPVIGIRLEDGPRFRIPKVVLGGVAVGLAGCVLAVSLFRGGLIGSRVFYTPGLEQDFGFSRADDMRAVVSALGSPARDSWQSDLRGRAFHILWYPRHHVYIVLMGQPPAEPRYIGMLDHNWRPIQAVTIPGQGITRPLLASLRRF